MSILRLLNIKKSFVLDGDNKETVLNDINLNIGEIVEITTKKKNWSRIKIIKGNEIIEGWVYTRYLQKIN